MGARGAMSSFVRLSGDRVCLRPWREADREAFAEMNSDPRVMEFFRAPLSRLRPHVLYRLAPA
jgi:RimJ/RimL family protein N-acetyltransferase